MSENSGKVLKMVVGEKSRDYQKELVENKMIYIFTFNWIDFPAALFKILLFNTKLII